MATQHDRELLVSSLLDISISQFRERIDAMSEDAVAALPDEINRYAGYYFSNIEEAASGKEGAAQLAYQQVCLMSDDTLREVVRLFGTDPLAGKCPGCGAPYGPHGPGGWTQTEAGCQPFYAATGETPSQAWCAVQQRHV